MGILEYANPTRVMRFSRIVKPWLLVSGILVLTAGLYGAFKEKKVENTGDLKKSGRRENEEK